MESDPYLVPQGTEIVHSHEASVVIEPHADAIVTVYGGLVFVTTGEFACNEIGACAEQLALTPAVALRIASVLRETLEHGDLRQRAMAIEVWSTREASMMPNGRIWVDEQAIHFTIEPLGAGAQIVVAWPHVPGLIVSLERAAHELVR